MARKNSKKNKNNIKIPEIKKTVLKKLLASVAFVVVLIIVYLSFKNLPYFKLADIEIIDRSRVSVVSSEDLLRIYKGINIFEIDIYSMASRIKSENPIIRDIVIKKILPNQLEIDVIPRDPIAKVDLHENFPIDKTGMLLPPSMRSRDLPTITGVNVSIWQKPRVGERLNNNQVKTAFQLIEALKDEKLPPQLSANVIDVSNYRNISFYLSNGIEIKIGGEEFRERLTRLKETLENPGFDISNVRYIDLRFKDVVIGPKL